VDTNTNEAYIADLREAATTSILNHIDKVFRDIVPMSPFSPITDNLANTGYLRSKPVQDGIDEPTSGGRALSLCCTVGDEIKPAPNPLRGLRQLCQLR
jgi:hypothetical protein